MLNKLRTLILCLLALSCKQAFAGSGYVNNNGVNIFYRDIGRHHDQTIVLLHGFPLSGEMFNCIISDLKLYFRIVAIDGRGFGRSDKPTDPAVYTFPDFISDVDAVVNHLGIPTFALGGMSYGSVTAEGYALAFPQKVSKLILIAPFFGQIENVGTYNGLPYDLGIPVGVLESFIPPLLAGEVEATDKIFIGLSIPETCKQAEEIKKVDLEIALQSPGYAQANLLAAQSIVTGYPDQIKNLNMPTLILYGNNDINDTVAPVSGVAELISVIPDNVALEVAGGHFLAQTQSKTMSSAIFSFMIDNPESCHTCYRK